MSDSINLNISNLKAFNRRLQKKLDTNKVKEYVSRGTLTQLRKVYKQAEQALSLKNTILQERTEHQHQIIHLLQIQDF